MASPRERAQTSAVSKRLQHLNSTSLLLSLSQTFAKPILPSLLFVLSADGPPCRQTRGDYAGIGSLIAGALGRFQAVEVRSLTHEIGLRRCANDTTSAQSSSTIQKPPCSQAPDSFCDKLPPELRNAIYALVLAEEANPTFTYLPPNVTTGHLVRLIVPVPPPLLSSAAKSARRCSASTSLRLRFTRLLLSRQIETTSR